MSCQSMAQSASRSATRSSTSTACRRGRGRGSRRPYSLHRVQAPRHRTTAFVGLRFEQHSPLARPSRLEVGGSRVRHEHVVRPVVSPRPRPTPRSHRRPLRRLETEERYIDSVSADGRTITLTQRLYFDHLGDGYWDETGEIVPEYRAEVGLLTRNVVVQGDEQSKSQQFGGQIVFASSQIWRARVSNLTSSYGTASPGFVGTTPSSAGSATSRSATRAKA